MTEPAASPARRIGFLGPSGTFTEQALLTQTDLADDDLVAIASIPEVLTATTAGDVDLGFVAIENSIEGTVNVTLDTLTHDVDLLVQREVVISIELNLLAPAGVRLSDIERVVSFPHASAQCRAFLSRQLPGAQVQAANSTAEAARLVGEAHADQSSADRSTAAIGTALAAKVYGLDVIAADIEDHPENQTRFVAVARHGVPAPTGHDKSTIVIFQRADRPGSLLAILQEFSARAINLTKLESRPTKRGLGDYCFIIDLEGHVADELVADCLRNLKSKQADVKFLGSYPAAGEHGSSVRRDADTAWRAADGWLQELRAQVADGR
ncbi:prephenate dehydratase [soil metagenome]